MRVRDSGPRHARAGSIAFFVAVLVALAAAPTTALAQAKAPSDHIKLVADAAYTWSSGDIDVVELSGNVTVATDDARMTARQAVVWLAPIAGGVRGRARLAQVVLIGDARLEHDGDVRSGATLYADEEIRGDQVGLVAPNPIGEDASDSELYQQAQALRAAANGATNVPEPITDRMLLIDPGSAPEQQPIATTQPTTQPSTVTFEAQNVEPVTSAEGKIAYVLSGDVLITQLKRGSGAASSGYHIELRADRGVIFTQLASLRELEANGAKFRNVQEAIYAAYLEGDVRIVQAPNDPRKSESRMESKRVYYDFLTDRAILTDAVLHTYEPDARLPLIVRADTVRQLSQGEFKASRAELTTSSFALPSYSIRSSEAYVHVTPTNIPGEGNRTSFTATNNTLDIFGVPMFWLPVVSGSMTERGGAFRNVMAGNSKNNGLGLRTEWGLMETLGRLPNENFDASYRLDYFQERGFATGLNVDYQNGLITETTRQPWDFKGSVKSYFVPDDQGVDKLGRERRGIAFDNDFRGHVLFEHQHFFPDDWQVQLRYGWVSDPTFLEYWEPNDFDTGPPHDFMAYVMHQDQTEELSLQYRFQPNNLVTNADELQESFPIPGPGVSVTQSFPVTIERLPELNYSRIGDSVGENDRLTFFSQNTVSVLRFNQSGNSLFDYGFFDARKGKPAVLPGIPSFGQTGIVNERIYRGDFRQELDMPLDAGPFKVVPYVVGRVTSYSDSPDEGAVNRLFAGTGVRVTTSFWKVDDSFENDFFDLHRLRHVIEPELNLFTSAQTYDRNDVFLYDEAIDSIYDVSAVSLGVRQRWQTKRGGPGMWRSVDFFTFDVTANFFANRPSGDELPPANFRGLYFPSEPEASVPRSSLNADAFWRISDTTVLLSDMQYNLDEDALATTSIGLAVQRDVHTSYFMGVRYLGEVNDTIASFALSYQLTTKYSLGMVENYSISSRKSQNAQFNLTRKFDRFFMTFGIYWDQVKDETGIRFGLFPEGFGYGLSTDYLQSVFGQ